MLRFIVFVLAIIFGISLIRSVAGVLMKALVATLGSPSSNTSAPNRPPVPTGGALKRDPVCGTFVSPESAVQRTVDGQDLYFCSAACRDKYRPA